MKSQKRGHIFVMCQLIQQVDDLASASSAYKAVSLIRAEGMSVVIFHCKLPG